jgi:VWFA-related protein
MGGLNSRVALPIRSGLAAFLFCSLAVLFSATSQAQLPPQEVSPPLRVNVDRVNVGVIVTGHRGHFIEDLHRGQFEVFDDGAPQPLTAFLSMDDPAVIVLMIECGPAVYFFRADLIRAADGLLTRLAPADRVALVCYDTSPDLRLGFTEDKEEARLALREMNFSMGFSGVNLTSSLFSVLHWLQSIPGKKTIVLVTSGLDTSPPVNPETIRKRLSASDVRILAISTGNEMQQGPKQGKLWRTKIPPEQREARAEVKRVLKESGQSLQDLSEITGGRVFSPKTSADFDQASEQIADLVRHEYDLEFAPPVHDGKLHSIEVRVKHHSYKLSYRQSYLAPPPTS